MSFNRRCFCLLMVCCFSRFGADAAAASDIVLSTRRLETPFGHLLYALPAGYCAVPDQEDGWRLSLALDRLVPPPPEARRARFLPCIDFRLVFEEKRWPLAHGLIQAEAFQHSRPGLDGLDFRLEMLQRRMIQALTQSAFARALLLHNLAPQVFFARPEEGEDDLIGGVLPMIRSRWPIYLEVVRERASLPMFRREGFVIGRDSYAVWWGGIERGGEGRVLAVVLGTTFVGDIAVTMGLSRAFVEGPRGPFIYNDLRKELLPALVMTLSLNGALAPTIRR